MRRKASSVRADWVSKTLAGVLLGLALAVSASGLLALALAALPLATRGQLVMWAAAPVWLGVCSSVYFFSSGVRAWLWLGGATVLSHAAWYALRAGQA
jgi:hypothetical protein